MYNLKLGVPKIEKVKKKKIVASSYVPACGNCDGCRASNCGRCLACTSSRKHGKGRKQKCLNRVCIKTKPKKKNVDDIVRPKFV